LIETVSVQGSVQDESRNRLKQIKSKTLYFYIEGISPNRPLPPLVRQVGFFENRSRRLQSSQMVSLVGPCQEMGSHSDVETLRDGILLRPHVLGRIHQMPHLSNHQNVLLTMCFRYVLTMVSRPGPKIEIWIRMGVANQRSYRTTNGNFEKKKPYIFI
jgi:hypothetical protein